jgi:hypothetical protein
MKRAGGGGGGVYLLGPRALASPPEGRNGTRIVHPRHRGEIRIQANSLTNYFQQIFFEHQPYKGSMPHKKPSVLRELVT